MNVFIVGVTGGVGHRVAERLRTLCAPWSPKWNARGASRE